jgi:hypothetical protein
VHLGAFWRIWAHLGAFQRISGQLAHLVHFGAFDAFRRIFCVEGAFDTFKPISSSKYYNTDLVVLFDLTSSIQYCPTCPRNKSPTYVSNFSRAPITPHVAVYYFSAPIR